MNLNGNQGEGEMLRSLRSMVLPAMLLAAMSMVGCANDAKQECKDACDGLEQEIEACQRACDAIR